MNLFLPEGYRRRLNPSRELNFDSLGKGWQAGVYRRAASLGFPTLVDVGAGSDCREGYGFARVIGVDLDYVRPFRTSGEFVASNLDGEAPAIVPDARSVVVCADVVEHLIDPLPLLRWLAECPAGAVAVSTPDRSRLSAKVQAGPPANLAHCQEWSAQEFDAMLESVGFRVGERFWCRPNEGRPENCYAVIRQQSQSVCEYRISREISLPPC